MDNLKRQCRGLIDSEWESICEFEEKDLWDYLSSMYPEITRQTSNEIYAEFFDNK